MSSIYGYENATRKAALISPVLPAYQTNSSTYQKTSNNAAQQKKTKRKTI